MSEQCVQVIMHPDVAGLTRLAELEQNLSAAIGSSETGEYDGNEIGDGEVILYMYGPDADALLRAIEPILLGSALARGATVIRRYGPPEDGVREVVSQL
jgi:hypothetical protein